MPTFFTGHVARFAVQAGAVPAVQPNSVNPVAMFLGDGANTADLSPVIANYILTAAGNNAQLQTTLLTEARDGLLQVINPQRINVAAPAVPATMQAAAQQALVAAVAAGVQAACRRMPPRKLAAADKLVERHKLAAADRLAAARKLAEADSLLVLPDGRLPDTLAVVG